ncbi:MAG TPA: DUF1028 domain-containing protein [Noviherbaspirillum sp.]|nr:DUF1028 domain-containing protein [Noviherbaspirillum sp.]
MTFSIVARCPRTGQIGVAAATALQAVGKLACHALPKVGAVASQALLNPYLAYDGLRLMEQGVPARTALERVLAGDPDANSRQVGIVDRDGNVAAWTGGENIEWAGDRQEANFSTQGNRLAGPQVLERVVETMLDTEELDLSERLCLALQAGIEVGGDTKGERSVNILVYGEEEYPLCDIRIDDHDDPLNELRRLFKLYQDEILPNMQKMPRRADIPRPL